MKTVGPFSLSASYVFFLILLFSNFTFSLIFLLNLLFQTRMTGGRRAVRRLRDQSATSGMDLTYVTERMIALWFPGDLPTGAFISGHQEAAAMLQGKHPDNYMVRRAFNIQRSTFTYTIKIKACLVCSDLSCLKTLAHSPGTYIVY